MGDFFRRIYYLLHRRRLEQELANDMAVHREMLGDENHKDFGNTLRLQEQSREAWGWTWFDRLLQDLRYGFRMLRKNPGYTAVALLALGLGIGVNTALFSVVYGVLLKPLPYAQGNKLIMLRQQFAKMPGNNFLGFSVKEIQDYRQQNRSLTQVEEYHGMSFILLDDKEPSRVRTGVVSAHFFDMLGIRPVFGRFFSDADETKDAEPVLVLSNSYWKSRYGGDPRIVGRHFRMNDKVHTVIGVLPPIPLYPQENDVYMPTVACPFRSDPMMMEDRNDHMMLLFGRIKPEETLRSASTDLGLIASRLEKAYPESYPVERGYTTVADSLQTRLTEDVRPMLLVLLGTAGLVLLIACANVANLALARMMRREQELAVRAAMGASRGRLVRQLLTESTLLSLGGGALGLWLASGCLGLDHVRRTLHQPGRRSQHERSGIAVHALRLRADRTCFRLHPRFFATAGFGALSQGKQQRCHRKKQPSPHAQPSRRGTSGHQLRIADRRRPHDSQLHQTATGRRRLQRRKRPLG